MNPEVKKLWLDALRSGEYKKGRGTLRQGKNSFRYCCLGVLCDLYQKTHPKNLLRETTYVEVVGNSHVRSTVWEIEGTAGDLPPSVMEWAGLEKRNPYCLDGSEDLAGLNDGDYGKLWTFKQIADLIEKEF